MPAHVYRGEGKQKLHNKFAKITGYTELDKNITIHQMYIETVSDLFDTSNNVVSDFANAEPGF